MATRLVDESFPGWVEVVVVEHDGTQVTLVEKAPVLDADDRLMPGTVFPVELVLACTVVGWRHVDGGRMAAVVELDHGVTAADDRSVFTVAPDQVVNVE